MSMLDAFFNKGFKASKCNTLLKLSIPRIKLLRNRREIQIKQMRRDIAKLLEAGQEATARIRVEHIIREENMMAAQEILELFCELISVRVPIIDTQRECPLDLKEAISSVCFAAPRCADLPELLQVQILFGSKYGKEFVSAATGLMPDCGVNRQLIELLSVRTPAPETKLKLLKEIAEEHDLDWNPAATETEFFKQPEDLLNGPAQFVSGSKLPLPKEKHDEYLHSTPDQDPIEQSDDDTGFDTLDFPEVPKVSLRPSADAASAPAIDPPIQATLHPEVDEHLSKHFGAKDNPLPMQHLEFEELEQERSVPSKNEPPNIPSGAVENKQFLPFVSPPSPSSATLGDVVRVSTGPKLSTGVGFPSMHSAMKNNSPTSLSRSKSEGNVDLQDVLAAAQAAAESAERAAAAARSAASLAQIRITELIKRKNDPDSEIVCENSFPTEILNEPATTEKQHFDHQDSIGSSDGIPNSPDLIHHHESHKIAEVSDMPSFDMPKVDDDTTSPIDHLFQHGPAQHQPRRLPSMDDDSYFSYPNLFSSQGSNLGSGAQSFTNNSRSSDL